MPRRKPSSPTAAPTYCERRLPAVTTSTTSPTLGVEPDRHVDDRAHVRAAEERPRERVPQRGDRAGVRDRAVPLVPRVAPLVHELVADALDAQLLARGRGGAEQEEVLGEPVVRRDRLLAPCARRPAATCS